MIGMCLLHRSRKRMSSACCSWSTSDCRKLACTITALFTWLLMKSIPLSITSSLWGGAVVQVVGRGEAKSRVDRLSRRDRSHVHHEVLRLPEAVRRDALVLLVGERDALAHVLVDLGG